MYKIYFTAEAGEDLLRMYDFPLDKDVTAAEKAIDVIKPVMELLRVSPYSCRKAVAGNPFLRELIIPFCAAGYVVLYEIETTSRINIIAVRYQREEDYH